MALMRAEPRGISDNADFFDAIAGIFAAIRDRVEDVIGPGNFKWALLVLLLLLALWYVRRQRLSSL